MDQKTYDLVMAILGADITREARTEIIKYYLLPRNTPVRPAIEYNDPDYKTSHVGTVKRPDAKTRDKREHPEKYEGEEAMRETLKGRIKTDEED